MLLNTLAEDASWSLLASGGCCHPWHSVPCSCIVPGFPSGFRGPSSLGVSMHPNFPLLMWTPVTGLRPTFIKYDLTVTPWQLQRPYIQVWSQSVVPSGYKFFFFWGVHYSMHFAQDSFPFLNTQSFSSQSHCTCCPCFLSVRGSYFWLQIWILLVIWFSNQRPPPQKTPSWWPNQNRAPLDPLLPSPL